MKIIRQDKKGHYDYGDIEIKECTNPDGGAKHYRITKVLDISCYKTLGIYSTEDKALKVMEMINEANKTLEGIKLTGLEYAIDIATRENDKVIISKLTNIKTVFVMPLDEEVD